MSKYVTPLSMPPELSGLIDPDAGFLCLTTYWRPNPQDPDPEMPGQKLTMSSYIPALSTQPCLCGSGKSYRACCQRQRMWRPICPNLGRRGYSLAAPQAATFHQADGPAIRERLTTDARLRCVDTSPVSSFWLLWGHPPVEDQYGILCFGDIELKQNHTLVVSAMSDLRMRILLDVLDELAGGCLGEPLMSHDPAPTIDKLARQARAQVPKGTPQRVRRRQ
ncbi:MAG: hypothetical protein EPO21_15665 [Chloroflexota bacterium]|nr:MAG: hypothetical protein EPO21_15665 [Chloroflexota bacterium]